MTNFTAKKLMTIVKGSIAKEWGVSVDFRIHKNLNSGIDFTYEMAKVAVHVIYDTLEEVAGDHPENFPEFGGWDWNEQMAIDRLSYGNLKAFIENKIDEMIGHHVNVKS